MSEINKPIKNKRKRKKRVFLFLFILLTVLLAVGVSVKIFFPVKSVIVTGSVYYEPSEILNASGIKKGDNMLFLTGDGVYQVIKAQLPYVDSVKLKRSLNGTLTLDVSDSKEAYCFAVGDVYYTTDGNFRVLSTLSAPSPAVMLVNGKVEINAEKTQITVSDSSDLNSFNEIISLCGEKGIKLDAVGFENPSAWNIHVSGRFLIDLGDSGNLSGKVSHLTGMLTEISPEASGRISLAGWTPENPRGYFVEETTVEP